MRDSERVAYVTARKVLRTAIKKAQESSWSKLCDEVEADPWELPYRLITTKLCPRQPMSTAQTLKLTTNLFPILPRIE
jgi:hypothetical protein